MNERLQSYARTAIFNDLQQCTPKQRRFFVIMYLGPTVSSLPTNVKEELTDEDVKHVIAQIPAEQLSWAMEQTYRTVLQNKGDK